MDVMRLTDVQKHRLTSQNEDCHHSKKHFWELPQVLCQVQKEYCFVRTQEFMFFVRSLDYYGHCLGPWMSCLVL